MTRIMNRIRLLAGGGRGLPALSGNEGQVTPSAQSSMAKRDAVYEAVGALPDGTEAVRTFRKVPWAWLSFGVFVVIPSLLAIAYFTLLASPQYAVEARLVVRAGTDTSSEDQKGSSVAGLGATYSPAAQNAYIVTQYIRSQAIIEELSKKFHLRDLFRRPDADMVARLTDHASNEELLDYWKEMVRSHVDGPSGIVTFQVRAFRPTDAQNLAEAIIGLSERLVNEISLASRRDIMRASEEEVRRADLNLRTALDRLQTARDAEGLLDPVKAADDTSKLLLQLLGEKIRMEGDLYAASRSLDKNSPTVRQLKSRVEIVENQIAALRSTLTGTNSTSQSVSSSLRRFEELEAGRFLADKLLTLAEADLDRARKRAERQELYFMVFVSPAIPTEAKYPERLAYSILFPIFFVIFWGIGTLIWAALQDHRI